MFLCAIQSACNDYFPLYRTGRGKWTRKRKCSNCKAANTDERSDDAEVYVNSGEFWIEKSADHYEWQVGEQVQYNVVVENKKQVQWPGT